MKIRAETEVYLNLPTEEVFDLWADARTDSEGKWEKMTPGPIGQGTTFKGEVKGMGAMTQQITEYDRPTAMTKRGSAKSFDFTNTFMFEPSGSRTRVRVRGEAEPRGLFKLLTPLLGFMLPRLLKDGVDRFAREIEDQRKSAF